VGHRNISIIDKVYFYYVENVYIRPFKNSYGTVVHENIFRMSL
jgi:hypothetical protein